jgi:hypothetical protein
MSVNIVLYGFRRRPAGRRNAVPAIRKTAFSGVAILSKTTWEVILK